MKFLERFFHNKRTETQKLELNRNDVCWCGSGKKYKRCHLDSDENKRRLKNGLKRRV